MNFESVDYLVVYLVQTSYRVRLPRKITIQYCISFGCYYSKTLNITGAIYEVELGPRNGLLWKSLAVTYSVTSSHNNQML